MSTLLQSLHAELGKLKDNGLAASLYAQGWETWSAKQAQLAGLEVGGEYGYIELDDYGSLIYDRDEPALTTCSPPDYALEWGSPTETPHGQRVFVSRRARLPSGHPFWTIWRSKGRDLQAQGFSVGQIRGLWYISQSLGSKAVTAPIVVDRPYFTTSLSNTAPLYPWQITNEKGGGAEETVAGLRWGNSYLNTSKLGAGKTIIALVAARELGLKPTVICPRTVKPAWVKAAKFVGVELHAVENYEKLRRGGGVFKRITKDVPKLDPVTRAPLIDEVTKKPLTKKKTVSFELSKDVQFTIWDEVHRACGIKSDNGKMLIAAKESGKPVLGLSASAASTPLRMKALGYVLGQHHKVGFSKWIEKYGCGLDRQFGGYRFFGDAETQKFHMARLHDDIGLRRMGGIDTNDIPGFPETTITTDYVEVGSEFHVDDLYEKVERAFLVDAEDHDELPIVKLLRARQAAELGKVPALLELIEDALDQDHSPVIFVNFTATLVELQKALTALKVPFSSIHGGQVGAKGERDREKAVTDFQADLNNVALVNVEAGKEGVRLNDIHGKRPRVAYISPPWSETTLRQVTGRIVGANSKSKSTQHILVAAGTAEERVEKLLAAKSARLDAFNDGASTQAP